jgi:hypothetical protein
LCTCVKKFRVDVFLKLKAGKMENPNELPGLQKKNKQKNDEKCRKRKRKNSNLKEK